ncbi:hypothetical protein [Neobacillus ginsengisoli]|uniref:Uncharacterized protein n=1 Tax=Neobacillus ginsengisoli TaxID=904295 RepID=A0ABT9Y024_9BACI|nr:hypothetical protein [Neobacillus ginsengisoli]MDQ0201099.1 hypothetical protein [Neobacillus ginsengisoli]
MLSKLNTKYDDALDKILYSRRLQPEKRQPKLVDLMDMKDQRKAKVEKESKTAVKKYMEPFVMKDIFTLYKELMSSP